MPPPNRKNPPRRAPTPTSNSTSQQTQHRSDALTDFQSRRLQRRLDDLERTNPTDIPASSFVPNQGQGQTQAQGKKKQSPNVRRVLYGKKSLKGWLEELPSEPRPPYLSAVAPPPATPPRRLCSSCGYTGAYKCQRCGEWSCGMECMGVHERDGGCGVGG